MTNAQNVSEELAGMVEDFNAENAGGSDRGVVLVRASGLDRILGRTLKDFLIDSPLAEKAMNGSASPLSSFSSKIEMCFLLDLIDRDEHAALHCVRKIRNDFAHQIGIQLNNQSLSARCSNVYNLAGSDADPSATNPREQFSAGTTQLLVRLVTRWH